MEITTWTAQSLLHVATVTPPTAGCWYSARNLVKLESAPNLLALSRFLVFLHATLDLEFFGLITHTYFIFWQ